MQRTIPKITVIAKITEITNQGSDNGKYNKSLNESRERAFTNVLKIPKISTAAGLTKITNPASHTAKYSKSLKESKKIPKITTQQEQRIKNNKPS